LLLARWLQQDVSRNFIASEDSAIVLRFFGKRDAVETLEAICGALSLAKPTAAHRVGKPELVGRL
jgi:hypothetical protein